MNNRVPGLVSILLLFAAFAIAIYQMITTSLLFGLIYTFLIPAAFLVVFYSYCRKCPHAAEDSCMHVIFGKITKRLFKLEKPSKYKLKEVLPVLISLGAIVGIPQFWLYKNLKLFAAFWLLTFAAALIVMCGVCTKCRNSNCAFCKNKKCGSNT